MSIVVVKKETSVEPGCYWHGTGRFEELGKQLDAFRFKEWGELTEYPKHAPKMERYRKMCNAYYDLFQNGGGNPGRGTARYFGKISTTFAWNDQWDACFAITEPLMDQAIIDAAWEMGYITKPEKLRMTAEVEEHTNTRDAEVQS